METDGLGLCGVKPICGWLEKLRPRITFSDCPIVVLLFNRYI
jgi:hypothetical protein